MSVFHRVEDIYTMNSALFFRRVACLPAYDGAVAAQHTRQQDTVREVQRAAPVAQDEEALWEQYRARRYAKYLPQGERPREVGVQDFMKILSESGGA